MLRNCSTAKVMMACPADRRAGLPRTAAKRPLFGQTAKQGEAGRTTESCPPAWRRPTPRCASGAGCVDHRNEPSHRSCNRCPVPCIDAGEAVEMANVHGREREGIVRASSGKGLSGEDRVSIERLRAGRELSLIPQERPELRPPRAWCPQSQPAAQRRVGRPLTGGHDRRP
jgi:hypothetical protein